MRSAGMDSIKYIFIVLNHIKLFINETQNALTSVKKMNTITCLPAYEIFSLLQGGTNFKQ